MNKPVTPEDGGRIVEESLSDALSRRYLAYALSTITHRALPDVRDGLKPVHRRVLFAMHAMRLNPEAAARKCAKVVGEVMGSFHPHGDQAIYDALVRLAQDFAQRYPLVNGQGNFGNIDGDSAAAMRYTECKLTPAAQLLLQGIDEDCVDFRPTYDGEDEEPVVLPAGFPNLLANGASGIAVGMATSIPPHNAAELIDACIDLLKDPELSLEGLLARLPGPDFPTGGVIVEPRSALREAYETGRGGVRLRARWDKEEVGRGLWRVVVTEIPYQVQKSRLIEQLAELIDQKKAPLLGDIRDESAEEIRLILEPRSRNIEPETLMESLFRLSDLEIRFPININVLDRQGVPGVMGLKACLRAYLDHRRDVLQRRSQWRRDRIARRLRLLDGLLVAYLNLDEVIRIVREAEHPKAELIERFALDEEQADFILDTRLRNLARLEEMEIRREHETLSGERSQIEALLGSESRQWSRIGQELTDTRKHLLSARRTGFADPPDVAAAPPPEAFVVREPVSVVVSSRGWIRAVKGRVEDPSELKFKEGDSLGFLCAAETTDRILVISSDGRAFTLSADKLPPGRGHGEPLRLMVDMDEGSQLLNVLTHQADRRLLVASSAGYGFLLPESDALAAKRGGKQIINLGDATLRACAPAVGDHVAIVGDNGRVLIFPLSDLPEMARGKGVKLQAYREGGLKSAKVFRAQEGLGWVDGAGRRRVWTDWRDWLGRRAGSGKSAPRGFRAFAE